VRSVGNNVAVNVWWKHHLSSDVNLDSCPPCSIDDTLTLDKLQLHGDGGQSASDDTQSLRLSSQLLARKRSCHLASVTESAHRHLWIKFLYPNPDRDLNRSPPECCSVLLVLRWPLLRIM